MPTPIDSLSPIFTPVPVNRHHPLNRGRAGWWLGLPGLMGGRQFFDLMGLNHGVLTSMGNGSNGWRSTVRSGGAGRIITDGSAGYVDCGTPAGLNGATQATLACWVYKASNAVAACFGGSAGPNNNRFSSIWYTDGNIYVSAEAASNNFGSFPVANFGWHRVVIVFDGLQTGDSARLRTYLDGLEHTLTFGPGAVPPALGSVGPVTIGKDSVARFGAGAYDDLSLWLRPLTPTEVQQDFILSQQGYPDVLNRLSSRVYSIPNSLGGYSNIPGFWFGGLRAVPPGRHNPLGFWMGGLYNIGSTTFRKHGTLIFG